LGLKERQERERAEVARAILDAARELFIAEGYQNVSIRKIAERVEYSPAAIYSYFASKDDIFFALAEEGFRMLSPGPDCCRDTDPLDAIRHAFWRVYEFSKTHPEYFALMFVDRTVPRINQDRERFGFMREMKTTVGASLRRAIDVGLLPAASDPDAIFSILATAIHGAAVRRLCQRGSPHEDFDALARDTLEATLAGLRAGSPVSLRPVGPEPQRD
jgi:AcrR family transcriptional regulator